MKNIKSKRLLAKGLIIAMCALPTVGCGKKDDNTKYVNGIHINVSEESYIDIDYYLEDPGAKIYDIGEHYFYTYDTRPSSRTPYAEGSLVINVPEGYEVYNYETLSYYRTKDVVKVTFVNTEPVYVESVKHEDRDDAGLGNIYYYWDYCYPGKIIELENEEEQTDQLTR